MFVREGLDLEAKLESAVEGGEPFGMDQFTDELDIEDAIKFSIQSPGPCFFGVYVGLLQVMAYNTERLHSAIGYVTSKTCVGGEQQSIFEQREMKLANAREKRRQKRLKNRELTH